jgi:hypothetical protein
VLLVSAPQALGALHLPANFFLFGNRIGLGQIATIISLLIISVLLLRRFLRAQREREQWRQEIEQARQLQQMLIPEALPHIAGLTIESEYRPALQVGGDFFQIIPESANGSVLIVVGELFGFERIGEMLRAATPQKPVSAAAMATAAQNFGQEDDISVLAITRTVNRAVATA